MQTPTTNPARPLAALLTLCALATPHTASASEMREQLPTREELLPLAASLAAAGGAAIALVDLHHAHRGERLRPELARRQLATGIALDVLAVPMLLSDSQGDARPIAGLAMATGGLGLITRACLVLTSPEQPGAREAGASHASRLSLQLAPAHDGGSVRLSGSF